MVIRLDSRWVRRLGLAAVAAAGYVAGLTADRVTAQPPGAAPLPPPDRRIVAYIYNTVPVTREELGDFLIARGGYEKLDLLVNKRIIEVEAARRNVTVTAYEVQAALEADVKGLGITLEQFATEMLKRRYNKTLYEWTEDVIKPRLLLGKMCQGRVRVTDEDLKKAYENKYGEKRVAKIICWSKQDQRAAEKQWDEARKSDAEFDRVARGQADPRLAASAGQIAPIGPYPDVEDETCTRILYQLKMGEISQLFQTPAGVMCIKLVAIVPADANSYKITDKTLESLKAAGILPEVLSKLDPIKNKDFTRVDLDAELSRILNPELCKLVNAQSNKNLTPDDLHQIQNTVVSQAADSTATLAKVRPALEREIYEKKVSAEVQKIFTELKTQANPNLLLKGPPTINDIKRSAEMELMELKQTGGK